MRLLSLNSRLAARAYARGRITAEDFKSLPAVVRDVKHSVLRKKLNGIVRYERWQRRNFTTCL